MMNTSLIFLPHLSKIAKVFGKYIKKGYPLNLYLLSVKNNIVGSFMSKSVILTINGKFETIVTSNSLQIIPGTSYVYNELYNGLALIEGTKLLIKIVI